MNNEVKLFDEKYEMRMDKVVFTLYKGEGEKEGEIEVDLRYRFEKPGEEEVTCKRIMYPACAEKYQSPYLSWYNLICCSNNYGPIPNVSYMNYAVQNGKKVAATIYPIDAMEYMNIQRDCDLDYYCFPYHIEEYQYMLYLSRKGTLADFFNLDEIMEVYASCGINLKKEKMEEYFAQDLSWFANEAVCPIEIHNCLGEEELATVGLLFGYPVESTIALINKTIDMCGF